MTFEEFEKADESKLREAAKERFEFGTKHPAIPMAAPSLLEAQFYMRELESRREKRIHEQERNLDKRVSDRDFLLEVLVIFLIGLEIVLAVKQGLDEDKLMGKQNGILTQLQQASAATASVMSKMNETIQTQAEEADKVLMEAQMDIYLLVLTNRGRPSMLEFGTKVGNSTIMEAQPRTMLSPSIYALDLRERLSELIKAIGDRPRYAFPLEVYLERGDGIEYVGKATITVIREKLQNGAVLALASPVPVSISVDNFRVEKTNWRRLSSGNSHHVAQ